MRKGLMTGLGLLMLALPASGQQAEPQALQITALNVTAEATQRTDLTSARPGDEVEYTLLFTNITDTDALNIVFSDPIPAGLVYVVGTASASDASTLVEYSLDRGTTWSTDPVVMTRNEAGELVPTPAPADRYTDIRWTVAGPVNPGAQVTASFRARVPAAEEVGS